MTHLAAVHPRLRKARSGPELEMVRAALAAGLPFSWSAEAVTFQEPELPSGAPDLVLLRMSAELQDASASLSERELKLLQYISSARKAQLVDLVDLLRWSQRSATGIVDALESQGFVVVHNDCLALTTKAKSFLAREIVAIEAKINDWRRALVQAQRNHWFASQSYVLLRGTVSSATIDAACDSGVGILHFDGNKARVLVRAERNRLPGSYASWLISMWGHHEVRP